ncbi:MAG: paraquat-inducible protein A [Candidatus Aminicenantaceae bacterium]|jgi:paraquat-inducible protein A
MSSSTQSKGKIWEHVIIDLLLWISSITFAIGIFAPVMTFKKLIFYTNTFSIKSGLASLFKEGEYILFLIIFVFTILFPVVKILLLSMIHYFRFWSQEKRKKLLHYLSLVSKWSMLDVFIVALLVVIVRLGISGKVEVRWGIYVFAVSVILSTLATQKLARSTHGPQAK